MRFLIKLFPWIESKDARKKIDVKIEKIISSGTDADFETMSGYERLENKELEEFYDSTFEVKSSLEDKIKSSLFSITLGIAIQSSTVSLLFNDSVVQQSVIFRMVLFIVGMISLLYLLTAGYYAIRSISEDIVVYKLSVADLSADEKERKRACAACVELNNHANTIRSNILSVTYRSIVNGLFLIVIFFILVGSGSFLIKQSTEKKIEVDMKIQPHWEEIELIKKELKNLSYEKDIKILEDTTLRQSKAVDEINKKFLELELKVEKIEKKNIVSPEVVTKK